MTVTVNGKTYSSLTGAVVVDAVNLTWYVQIPDSDALAVKTYDVDARIISELGGTTDKTSGELTIAPTPPVIIEVDGVDGNNKGTSYTMNNQGGWQLFTNQAVLDSSATDNSTIGQFDKTILTPNTGGAGNGSGSMNMVQNSTFVDFNRDGYMDILGIDSRYSNGQQMFINNGDDTYTAKQMADSYAPGDDLANTYSWFGGIAAIDLMGDGYVDVIIGDQTPNDANATGGYNSQIVLNNGGVFIKDDWYTDSRSNGGKNTGNATFGQELSGVDLDNNGTIDVVFHERAGSNKLGAADGSGTTNSSNNRLVVAKNDGDGKLWTSQMVTDVFRDNGATPNLANEPSMTWADFNGDGYMDLFLGSVMGNSTTSVNNTIYFNDGKGNLSSTNPTGIGTSTGTYQFNDKVMGGASVAVDWNGDGKMDIIEAPQIGDGTSNSSQVSGTVNMYTNTTSGSSVSFGTTYMQVDSSNNGKFVANESAGTVFKGGIGSTGTVAGNPITGMISVDLDYDGVKDLLVFTSKGQTTYVHNDNKVAHGTSLHLRIVDAQGLTIFYGNTVQLVDSSGKVVATQIINPQSGGQTNDSSSVVDFYGLNPNETYSVVLLRNVMGVSQDVGGIAQVGTNVIENVNLGWANIKAGASNEALILTAESGTNSADTLSSGIVGTGYNDTFIATQGTKTYEGGGGTTEMSNYKTWTDTGGMDIVDFKLAGSTALNINMMNKSSQFTGWNYVTLKNIEGLAGGAGNDTFTDDAGDNVFEGRGGNDTFNLLNGGRDTLLYKPQVGSNGDNRGGNGTDVVNGFTLGAWEATPDADRIDVSEMLVGYTFGGGAKWINGVATMESGETIGEYLKVVISGSDTLIYIDRDGNGGAYGSELLLTLKDVQTDLITLLANHQLEVDNSDTVGMSATTSEFQALTQMFTAGNDILFGTEQEDVLLGGLGNDTFINIGKGDQVSGGDGNDIIKIISTDFASISGDEGIDTLILDTTGELLDLSALKDKLSSVEIFDMGNGNNTMNVSLEDVLRLGSEELAINSGNKAIVVNGEAGSTLQLDGTDGQWTMSQSNYQYQGNTYNVWTSGTSGIEVLVENTVNPVIL
ncbi:FG-GAP repeat domain-containing protein [Limnobaculum xujianqingii]|uniref:FG-GAP repeat domain-containing protein n=1 Tax=Limnobaculum xujianqingii TaxID=2738837 RepID=UPI00112D9BE1|nr:VCBS repeat-containing protein [Limnobaculum xujianqingii]